MKKIQSIIIALLLAIGVQPLFAQPATPAPEPTRDGSDVVSTFSNYYPQTGKGVEPQSWGGTAVTKTTIAGYNDDVLQTSGASAVVFTSGWTAQTKSTIHIDVYSVSGGSFSFGLGNTTDNNLFWANYTWPSIPAGVWTGIDVPILEFYKAGLNNAANVQTIKFSGSGTYYIDNIYAYGPPISYDPPAVITTAPTPRHTASDVKSVFSDTYTPSQKGVTPQSFGGILAKIMPYATAPEEKVLRLTGLGSSLSTIDTWRIKDKATIHVDVYWDGNGDGSFSFGMNATNWSGNNIVSATSGYTWPSTRMGQWVGFDIPVAVFEGLNTDQITQIKFFGSGNFYIDNLYAYSLPVGMDQVNVNSTQVHAENGVLQATFEGQASVKLYTVSGQLLDQKLAVNQYAKALSQGIYILNIDGKAYKVFVK